MRGTQKQLERLAVYTSNILRRSLEAAGDGGHSHERVRRDDRDVFVQRHHERLQLLRHLPRGSGKRKNTQEQGIKPNHDI